jgi:hypothetical protein
MTSGQSTVGKPQGCLAPKRGQREGHTERQGLWWTTGIAAGWGGL